MVALAEGWCPALRPALRSPCRPVPQRGLLHRRHQHGLLRLPARLPGRLLRGGHQRVCQQPLPQRRQLHRLRGQLHLHLPHGLQRHPLREQHARLHGEVRGGRRCGAAGQLQGHAWRQQTCVPGRGPPGVGTRGQCETPFLLKGPLSVHPHGLEAGTLWFILRNCCSSFYQPGTSSLACVFICHGCQEAQHGMSHLSLVSSTYLPCGLVSAHFCLDRDRPVCDMKLLSARVLKKAEEGVWCGVRVWGPLGLLLASPRSARQLPAHPGAQTPVATLIGSEGAGVDVPAWAGSCPQLTTPLLPAHLQLLLQRRYLRGRHQRLHLPVSTRLHGQLLPARRQRV